MYGATWTWIILNILLLGVYGSYAYMNRDKLILGKDVMGQLQSAQDWVLLPWSQYVHADSRYSTHRAMWLVMAGFVVTALLIAVAILFKLKHIVVGLLIVQVVYMLTYGASWLWSWKKGELDLSSTTWQIYGMWLPMLLLWMIVPGLLAISVAYAKS